VLFDSSTTPDEVGLVFTPTVPLQLHAAWFGIVVASGRDVDAVLYGSDGSTMLETVELDMDVAISTGPWTYVAFAQDHTLAAGGLYRLTIRAETMITDRIFTISVASQAILATMPGGTAWYRTERTDAGSWTDTVTQMPFCALVVSGFDDGAGGSGGLLTHPGMSGGLRG
jgi:hypothetical protein